MSIAKLEPGSRLLPGVRRAVDKLNLHRILLPLDSSPEAEAVIPYALMLAKWFDSEMRLIYVIRTLRAQSTPTAEGQLYPDTHHDRGVNLASAYLKEICRKLSPHNVRTRWGLATGDIAYMIVSRSLVADVGLILVRTNIRPFFDDIWGGVFEKLWRTTPLPLLAINKFVSSGIREETLAPPQDLIVPISSTTSIETVMPYVKPLAISTPLNIKFVFTLKRPFFLPFGTQRPRVSSTDVDKAIVELEELGCQVTTFFTAKPMDVVLELQALYRGCWTIAASHMHSPIFRILLGSFAFNLIKRATAPVFVIPFESVAARRVKRISRFRIA